MSKVIELQARVALDYDEIIQPFLKQEPKEIVSHAYELAHYNEIADMFENIEEFDDIVIDNLINYQGNIFVRIYQSWLNYYYPENYNFFEIDTLIGIVCHEFRRKGE